MRHGIAGRCFGSPFAARFAYLRSCRPTVNTRTWFTSSSTAKVLSAARRVRFSSVSALCSTSAVTSTSLRDQASTVTEPSGAPSIVTDPP